MDSFDFKQPSIDLTAVQIDGQRISLLPINESYASEIFKEFDSEITRYMLPKPAENIEETLTFIHNSLDGMREGKELVLVVTKRDDGEFLGCCGLHGRGKPRTPEIGIWLKKDAHGNQYGREAIHILFSWAVKNIVFDYAIYPVAKANAASRKIAESLGVSDVNYFVRFASIILAGLLTFVSLLDSSFVGRDYVRLLAGK